MLRVGDFADVTIFDPEKASINRPTPTRFHYNEGIDYVIVTANSCSTEANTPDAMPGKALRHRFEIVSQEKKTSEQLERDFSVDIQLIELRR